MGVRTGAAPSVFTLKKERVVIDKKKVERMREVPGNWIGAELIYPSKEIKKRGRKS